MYFNGYKKHDENLEAAFRQSSGQYHHAAPEPRPRALFQFLAAFVYQQPHRCTLEREISTLCGFVHKAGRLTQGLFQQG